MYCIDGYNLLHHVSNPSTFTGKDYETARDILLSDIAHFCSITNEQVHIVFDGRGRRIETTAPSQHTPGVSVSFSSKHTTADTVIERFVYQATDRKQIIVVTQDHGIRDLCHGLGSMVMSPQNFWSLVHDAHGDIRQWLQRVRQHRQALTLEDRLEPSVLAYLRRLKQRLEHHP